MRVSFSRHFNKQLSYSNDKRLAIAVFKTIQMIKEAQRPEQIPRLKKLKGHPNAFRLRVGDFRIGLFIEGNKVDFAALAHRKGFP